MRERLERSIAATPFWVLLSFAGLTAYWLVRSIVRANTLPGVDGWGFRTWFEIPLYACGLGLFLLFAIVKMRARNGKP